MKTFEEFFDMIGADLSLKIEFVCSDMWKPYPSADGGHQLYPVGYGHAFAGRTPPHFMYYSGC